MELGEKSTYSEEELAKRKPSSSARSPSSWNPSTAAAKWASVAQAASLRPADPPCPADGQLRPLGVPGRHTDVRPGPPGRRHAPVAARSGTVTASRMAPRCSGRITSYNVCYTKLLRVQRFHITPEERALQAKFGEAFTDYKRHVRRWL